MIGPPAAKSELIAVEGNLRRAREVVRVRIGSVIPDLPEHIAVVIIGTGFVSGVDHASARSAVLGRSDARVYAKFLNRHPDSHEEHDRIDERLIVVDAVKQEVVRLYANSVRRNCPPPLSAKRKVSA